MFQVDPSWTQGRFRGFQDVPGVSLRFQWVSRGALQGLFGVLRCNKGSREFQEVSGVSGGFKGSQVVSGVLRESQRDPLRSQDRFRESQCHFKGSQGVPGDTKSQEA